MAFLFFSLGGLLLVCVLGKVTWLLFCFGFLSICVLGKGTSMLLFERKSSWFGKGEGTGSGGTA